MTGLGVYGRDKRMSTTYGFASALTEDELNGMYRGEGMARRIIDILVEDMTKKPFEVTGDPDNSMGDILREIGAYPKIAEGLQWGLLHGDAIATLLIDDGGFLDEPVNENNVRSFRIGKIFDRWRVTYTNSDLYTNPENPKYGTPEFFNVFPINSPVIPEKIDRTPLRERMMGYWSGTSFRIHESRVLRFSGNMISEKELLKNGGWHDSYLQSVFDRLRGLGEAYAGIETIISEFMLGTITMEDLARMIAENEWSTVYARLQMLDTTKHSLNTIAVDSKEDYKREFANVSGLPECVNTLTLGISSTTGIPVTRLMGQSPAGLNATGDNDMRMYYDKITSMQQSRLLENCNKVVKYATLAKELTYKGDKKKYEVQFPKLYELTELEEAELRNMQSDTDRNYYDMGVVEPEELADSRFGGNKYSTETVIKKGIKRERPVKSEPAQILPRQPKFTGRSKA